MKFRRKWVFVAAAIVATGAVACAIWMDIRHGQDPAEAKARHLVAELCRRFKDEPPTLWERLLSELGLTGDLDDLDLDEIRSKLASLGKSAVPPLVEALEEHDPNVRANLIPVLGSMGPAGKKAVPTLIVALTDYSEEMFWSPEFGKGSPITVSRVAKDALVELGRTGTGIAEIAEALKHNDWHVRSSAAEILGRIGKPAEAAVPALQRAIKDESCLVRSEVVEALGKVGPAAKQAVPALIDALNDQESMVRSSAAEAVGNIGPAGKEAVPALEGVLKDQDKGVQCAAAGALAKLGVPGSGLPVLIAALEDESAFHREWVATMLGEVGAPAKAAIPALRKALKDKNEAVRHAAAEALKKIRREKPPATGAPQ